MKTPTLEWIDAVALIRFPVYRVCYADQLERLFAWIDQLLQDENVSHGVVSLETLSFARDPLIQEALSNIMRERERLQKAKVFWANGTLGDATFIRSAAALGRVTPRVYTTEREALNTIIHSPLFSKNS